LNHPIVRKRRRILFSACAMSAAIWLSALPLCSQTTPDSPPATQAYKAPLLYLHLAGGFGLDYMSSGEMDKLLDPYRGGGIGINLFGGLRVGILNALQLEYRADATWQHNFTQSGDETYIEMTNTTPKIYLVKFNPLFWQGDPHIAWFLVYGVGSDAKYYDEEDSGWKKGDLKIYGLEIEGFAWLTKGISFEAGFSAEYRTVTYNKFDLAGFGSIGSPFKASFVVLALHYGIGFGF